MLFQNNPVDLTTLPQLEDISMESLSPSYLTVSYCDLYIPGLPGDRADQLRDYIIEKVGKHEQ